MAHGMSMYKSLGDRQHHHLGNQATASIDAQEEVADLPGSVFFSARVGGDPAARPPGLFYKDPTGSTRRVLITKAGAFQFSPLVDLERFAQFCEILFVPEVDPRAWAAAKDTAKHSPVPVEFAELEPGTFFTALGSTESLSSQRRGVYRLGRAGTIQRLLKDATQGLVWSGSIPKDRFGNFGERLTIDVD